MSRSIGNGSDQAVEHMVDGQMLLCVRDGIPRKDGSFFQGEPDCIEEGVEIAALNHESIIAMFQRFNLWTVERDITRWMLSNQWQSHPEGMVNDKTHIAGQDHDIRSIEVGSRIFQSGDRAQKMDVGEVTGSDPLFHRFSFRPPSNNEESHGAFSAKRGKAFQQELRSLAGYQLSDKDEDVVFFRELKALADGRFSFFLELFPQAKQHIHFQGVLCDEEPFIG